MSERQRRKNGCGRKIAYPFKRFADREAHRLNCDLGEAVDVYLCPWTDVVLGEHYHVGHEPKPPKPERTPEDRIRLRLAVIARHEAAGRRLTAWQHAYAEDVRWLLGRPSDGGADIC